VNKQTDQISRGFYRAFAFSIIFFWVIMMLAAVAPAHAQAVISDKIPDYSWPGANAPGYRFNEGRTQIPNDYTFEIRFRIDSSKFAGGQGYSCGYPVPTGYWLYDRYPNSGNASAWAVAIGGNRTLCYWDAPARVQFTGVSLDACHTLTATRSGGSLTVTLDGQTLSASGGGGTWHPPNDAGFLVLSDNATAGFDDGPTSQAPVLAHTGQDNGKRFRSIRLCNTIQHRVDRGAAEVDGRTVIQANPFSTVLVDDNRHVMVARRYVDLSVIDLFAVNSFGAGTATETLYVFGKDLRERWRHMLCYEDWYFYVLAKRLKEIEQGLGAACRTPNCDHFRRIQGLTPQLNRAAPRDLSRHRHAGTDLGPGFSGRRCDGRFTNTALGPRQGFDFFKQFAPETVGRSGVAR